MRKFGLRVIVSLIIGVIMLAGGALIYLQQPLFGKLPTGERLVRITHSPHYMQGMFRNEIPTPMKTTDQSELSMWMETFFPTKGQPRPPEPIPVTKTNLKNLDPGQDLVVWLGHSSFFIQLGGHRFLLDPVFSHSAAPLPGINTEFPATEAYTADDMPHIDVLLISHDHYDHLDYNSIIALKPKVSKVIVGLGIGADFEAWGYDMRTVHEADWNEAITIAPGLKVYVTPARHFSGRAFTRDQTLWVGYALVSPQRRLFFSGDSGYGPHFADTGRQLGPFDLVALDMGQYDPRWANVHMNPEQAARAAQELKTRVLIPAHVGRFSIAPHDWDDPFKRIVAASHHYSYALWTPSPGQPVYPDGRLQKFSYWWEANSLRSTDTSKGKKND